jgi:Flp pilus assembly protein TadG
MARYILKRNRRRGTAAVEAAFSIAVLLLPLLLGAWEMGRMVEVQQVLTNGAREGCRQASTGKLTNAQVQQVVVTYLQNAGLPTTNAVVTVSDLTASGTDVSLAAQLDQLQVTVTIPFSDVRVISLNLVTNSSTNMTGQAIWYSLRDKPYAAPSPPPIE